MVLEQKVLSDRGKYIIRSNEDNYNAPTIMIHETDYLYETRKRVTLENAVAKLVETRQVKNKYDIIETQTDIPMSFENCYNLDTSAEHDQHIKAINKDKDQVFMHENVEE